MQKNPPYFNRSLSRVWGPPLFLSRTTSTSTRKKRTPTTIERSSSRKLSGYGRNVPNATTLAALKEMKDGVLETCSDAHNGETLVWE
jgi:hypothetical protein